MTKQTFVLEPVGLRLKCSLAHLRRPWRRFRFSLQGGCRPVSHAFTLGTPRMGQQLLQGSSSNSWIAGAQGHADLQLLLRLSRHTPCPAPLANYPLRYWTAEREGHEEGVKDSKCMNSEVLSGSIRPMGSCTFGGRAMTSRKISLSQSNHSPKSRHA